MEHVRRCSGHFVLIFFAVLVATGLAMHEYGTVLANAITICLNCIGIG